MEKVVISIIGAGTIGSAIAKALVNQKFVKKIIATRRNVEKIKDFEKLGIEVSSDNKKAAREADVIIITLRPENVIDVLLEICREVEEKLVISLVAAIPLDLLQQACPRARFIRGMPNPALLVREAFTAYSAGKNVEKRDIEIAEKIFGSFGKFARVEEEYLDAMTALNCVIGYIPIIIEGLTDGGVYVGLPRELSLLAVTQNILGAAKLILDLNLDPEKIEEIAATPGGMTIRGIYEIENSNIRGVLMKAIETSTERCKFLSSRIVSSQRKKLQS